jgi:hypothetical protein
MSLAKHTHPAGSGRGAAVLYELAIVASTFLEEVGEGLRGLVGDGRRWLEHLADESDVPHESPEDAEGDESPRDENIIGDDVDVHQGSFLQGGELTSSMYS